MHLGEGDYTVVELRIQDKLKEATKSGRESMGVRPQARAQSKSKPKKSSRKVEIEPFSLKRRAATQGHPRRSLILVLQTCQSTLI